MKNDEHFADFIAALICLLGLLAMYMYAVT